LRAAGQYVVTRKANCGNYVLSSGRFFAQNFLMALRSYPALMGGTLKLLRHS
jgi:hypothetical protein